MFGMSVNEVPGWSVAMAPRSIGVPVALTPGLVPHCEVLTVPLLLEPELHPASTPPTARTEAMAAPVRHRRLWVCCIILCLLVASTKDDSERPGALPLAVCPR